MKKAVAVTALCILLVLVPICTVYASQPFYYSMDIPAAITLKKSAQAKLCLSSPSGVQLGTAVFTVRYDPNVLTYKEADIADGMPGEMRAVEDGGLVKIVYLNANGTTLPTSEATPMILLRFTALSTQCKTTLTLYTEQAVDINEQKMTVQDPIEYQVTLQEKETTSSASPPAEGCLQALPALRPAGWAVYWWKAAHRNSRSCWKTAPMRLQIRLQSADRVKRFLGTVGLCCFFAVWQRPLLSL